jgi:hypothetical protein
LLELQTDVIAEDQPQPLQRVCEADAAPFAFRFEPSGVRHPHVETIGPFPRFDPDGSTLGGKYRA